jgi:hypothetical protein
MAAEASSLPIISRAKVLVALCLAALILLSLPGTARAQSVIKQPGNHPDYSFEIEPHLAFQWADRLGSNSGFGPGLRANIPFLHNGPIPSINNNMGITFGADLTFGNGGYGWCYGGFNPQNVPNGTNCSVIEFWLPVAVQWNFFLTKVISVFGEPGLAIVHRQWSYQNYCGGNVCDYSRSENDLQLILEAGARFMFSDRVGATVRLGFPMITAGINILL